MVNRGTSEGVGKRYNCTGARAFGGPVPVLLTIVGSAAITAKIIKYSSITKILECATKILGG